VRRLAIALLLGTVACSERPAGQDAQDKSLPRVVPAPQTPSGTLANPAASTGSLRGQVSTLSADRSGLETRVTDLGTIVALAADTLFEFDRADLTKAAEANLGKVAELIRGAPPGPIVITGHTDGKGEEAYNLRLSQARAQAVTDWMKQQVGVRQRSFTVVGKGESEPIAANSRPGGSDDPDGRARNRRVELLIPSR
jgi:outer membrane protein OmpA-like peptidoglycan-associated protein